MRTLRVVRRLMIYVHIYGFMKLHRYLERQIGGNDYGEGVRYRSWETNNYRDLGRDILWTCNSYYNDRSMQQTSGMSDTRVINRYK